MRTFVTLGLSALLLGFVWSPSAQAQPDTRTHDTGTIQFDVFDNGFLGESANFGDMPAGFTFNGNASLFEGQVVVATSQNEVCGEPYAGSQGQEGPNWQNTVGFTELTPPFDTPYEEFDTAYLVEFDCGLDPNPLPVSVLERSYSGDGDPYMIVELDVRNESTSDLDSVYVGIFADFDVGNFETNFADWDDDTNMLYVWDSSGVNTDYFGMLAVNGPVSGYEFDAGDGFNPSGATLFFGMTNGGEAAPDTTADRRTVMGVGPFDLAAGEGITRRFAFVAGTDEDNLIANAEDAISAVAVAIEAGPDGLPGTHALGTPYPNPAAGDQARFTLEVADAQTVRVAVYDVLGRQVALVHNGTLAANAERTFELDTHALPSGIYLIRAQGEQFNATQQLTLTR